jgi:hypothetical protein
MTKTQRELSILGGILLVLSVLLVLRFRPGGAGSSGTVPPATGTQTAANRPAPRPAQPGGTPATAPGTVAIPLSQYPLELLEPGLSDSMVTAKITTGGFADPFSRDRGRVRETAPTPTRPTIQAPAAPRPWRDQQLSEWPPGVRYQGVIEKVDAPGSYTVRFNGQIVDVGEKIPTTDWILAEANAVLIRIRREDTRNRIRSEYRYLLPPP